MSDELKDLQKTENEKSRLLDVPSHPNFEPTLKLVQLGVLIMTAFGLLAAFLAWFAGFSYWLYIPIGALVFCLLGVGWHFLVLRPKNRQLEAKISVLQETEEESALLDSEDVQIALSMATALHQKEIDAMQIEYDVLRDKYDAQTKSFVGLQEELGKEKLYNLGHQDTIKQKESDIEQYKKMFDEKKEIIDDNQLPITLAQVQRDNIDAYVILESFFFCRISTETVPRGIFVLKIRNNSMFSVELDKDVKGEIWFDNLELEGNKRFNRHSSPTIRALKVEEITLEIQITSDELNYMDKQLATFNKTLPSFNQFGYENLFRIDDLIFTIKDVRDEKDVKEELLVTSKPLKIKQDSGRVFKVVNRDKYSKATAPFEQF
jgi:hypothetical protein